MTVLVIDDELVIRTLAQRILQKAGYTVETASSGEDGIAVLQQSPAIALVIVDSRMPELSGEETLRRIRDLSPKVPCIISSGSMDIEHELAGDLRPMTWFLRKPYQSHELLSLVEKALAMCTPGH